jgi:hypothetical protein
VWANLRKGHDSVAVTHLATVLPRWGRWQRGGGAAGGLREQPDGDGRRLWRWRVVYEHIGFPDESLWRRAHEGRDKFDDQRREHQRRQYRRQQRDKQCSYR